MPNEHIKLNNSLFHYLTLNTQFSSSHSKVWFFLFHFENFTILSCIAVHVHCSPAQFFFFYNFFYFSFPNHKTKQKIACTFQWMKWILHQNHHLKWCFVFCHNLFFRFRTWCWLYKVSTNSHFVCLAAIRNIRNVYWRGYTWVQYWVRSRKKVQRTTMNEKRFCMKRNKNN